MRTPKPRSRRPRRPARHREAAPPPLLLDARQSARFWGIGHTTFYRLLAALPAPVRLPGERRARWARESLECWVRARSTAAAEAAGKGAGG